MALPTLIAFVAGEDALAEDVNTNFDRIAGRFNAGILDEDISPTAGIKGYKLSASTGDRVPETRLENNAVSARVLASNASSGSRAVGSSHIQDGSILAAHIAAGVVGTGHIAEASVGRSKLKFGTVTGPSAGVYSYAPGYVLTTWNLGLSASTTQVLGFYMNGNWNDWNGVSVGTFRYFFAIQSGVWVVRFESEEAFAVGANGWVVTYLTIA